MKLIVRYWGIFNPIDSVCHRTWGCSSNDVEFLTAGTLTTLSYGESI